MGGDRQGYACRESGTGIGRGDGDRKEDWNREGTRIEGGMGTERETGDRDR